MRRPLAKSFTLLSAAVILGGIVAASEPTPDSPPPMLAELEALATAAPVEGSGMGGDLTEDQVAAIAFCTDLGMFTREDGTCYAEGTDPGGHHEPTPPGMPLPLPYCADGVTVSDGTCEVYPTPVESTPAPAPAPLPAPPVVEQEPHEDTEAFDCRVHGNDWCGVVIEGQTYVIHFIDGKPVSVAEGIL